MHELPEERKTVMSTFMPLTSRVDIEARIAERRRADNRNELPTRSDDDYYQQPTAKDKAQAELMKWLCQV
jgi:hypothetical protein